MDQYCKNSIREHYLHIDSRDRDTTQHPNSNEYVINFQKYGFDQFWNVVSVELLCADIPKSEFNVHSGNNFIDFQMLGVDYSVQNPGGMYSSGTSSVDTRGLCRGIADALNASGAPGTFTVTLVVPPTASGTASDILPHTPATHPATLADNLPTSQWANIQITHSTTNFTLLFSTGENKQYSAREIMGFAESDYTSAANALTAPYYYSLTTSPGYVNLDIKELDQRLDSTDNNMQNTFAVIYFDSGYNNNVNRPVNPIRGYEFGKIEKVCNPVRKQLSRFTIKFYKRGGKLYDFHNRENSLKFVIRTLNN